MHEVTCCGSLGCTHKPNITCQAAGSCMGHDILMSQLCTMSQSLLKWLKHEHMPKAMQGLSVLATEGQNLMQNCRCTAEYQVRGVFSPIFGRN